MSSTKIVSHIGPRQARPMIIAQDSVTNQLVADLARIGIAIDSANLKRMMIACAQDSLTAPITSPSVTTPIQFLQAWLPGFVKILTQARKIDELVGVTTAGKWSDEEVVQGVLEQTGTATPYADYGNVPLSSWNTNFERRTIVRFEEGLRVGRLEEERASSMNTNSAENKREAAAVALEIQRNKVGFYGYNDGDNRTYGFLTDPSLPAYVPVANNGGGDSEWPEKDFLEITADIRSAVSDLRTQSGDQIDPYTTQITLGLPTESIDYLSITNALGTTSVREWLNTTYPKLRVVSAPELNGANGGENVFYLYAESVADGSNDDGRTFLQIVPAKFMTLGVEQQTKAYVEDFTNATAGVMLKRPYAVVRRSGI